MKSLALHTATPKIEAFYSWYKDNGLDTRIGEREGCGSWVDWYGEIVCDLETLLRYAGHETLDSADPAWRCVRCAFNSRTTLTSCFIVPNPSINQSLCPLIMYTPALRRWCPNLVTLRFSTRLFPLRTSAIFIRTYISYRQAQLLESSMFSDIFRRQDSRRARLTFPDGE